MEYPVFSFSNRDDWKRIALKSSTMHRIIRGAAIVCANLAASGKPARCQLELTITSRLLAMRSSP